MKISIVQFALALAVFAVVLSAQTIGAEDDSLPFPVKIGGHAAKPVTGKAYAVVSDAVASDAELEVTVKDNTMVIANVFPANDNGDVKEGGTPAILILQKSSKTTLNKTMDSKALPAGNYRINIVADGKTAIVNFKVK